MRVSIAAGLLILAAIPLFIGQACTDATKLGNTKLGSTTVDLSSDKPIVDCDVINTADNKSFMHITGSTGSSSYPLNPPAAPIIARIDCSKSSSPVNAALSFAFTKDGVAVTATGSSALINMPAPGKAAIGVVISDSKNSVTNKAFNVTASCNPASYPALQVNANALSVAAASKVGYLNVGFAGVASGGTGQYAYSVDLNGDGRFDNYNQTLYSSVASFTDMYSLYSGTRNVGVRVLDTGCQFVAQGAKSVNFASIFPAAQSGAMAQPAAYYYLQGNVNNLTAADIDVADKVQPFQAMEGPATPRLHVDCSYTKTSMSGPGDFAIRGINAYDDGTVPSGVNAQLIQGLTLKISDVQDDGSAGPNIGPAHVTSAIYQTASSPDGGLNQYTFNKSPTDACTTTLQITRATAAAPCESGQGINSPVVIIQGVYSCPKLHANSVVNDTSPTAATGRDISITNGYFYCEYAPADQCYGGGQGGGGEPPPVF